MGYSLHMDTACHLLRSQTQVTPKRLTEIYCGNLVNFSPALDLVFLFYQTKESE